MSTSPPESHQRPTAKGSEASTQMGRASSEALTTTLRGSSVGKVDTRRVGRVLLVLCLVTLAVLVVVFSVAGAHRNSQISSLRNHGVTAEMTVTGCAVLIGGSGSTPAGDACRGAFTLDGHRYTEPIPGSAEYTTGQSLRIKVVPGDPALLSPVEVLQTEHSSWTVFVLSAILFLVLLLILAGLVVERRGAGTRRSRLRRLSGEGFGEVNFAVTLGLRGCFSPGCPRRR
jgi:hypothetical protein